MRLPGICLIIKHIVECCPYLGYTYVAAAVPVVLHGMFRHSMKCQAAERLPMEHTVRHLDRCASGAPLLKVEAYMPSSEAPRVTHLSTNLYMFYLKLSNKQLCRGAPIDPEESRLTTPFKLLQNRSAVPAYCYYWQ
jgi:hypothetical protein